MPVDLLSISATSIDLSRLPVPTVVVQTLYEDERAALVARMIELQPDFDATVESDPVLKLIEDFDDRCLRVLLAFADGSNLDPVGVPFAAKRLIITLAASENSAFPESDEAHRQRILSAPERGSGTHRVWKAGHPAPHQRRQRHTPHPHSPCRKHGA